MLRMCPMPGFAEAALLTPLLEQLSPKVYVALRGLEMSRGAAATTKGGLLQEL